MTSRESFSSGHVVITHWKGGWKRTHTGFPGGRCFISLLFSRHPSGRRYHWNRSRQEMEAVTWSSPVPIVLLNSGCAVGLLPLLWCKGWGRGGAQHRNRTWPGRTVHVGTWARQSIPTRGPQLGLHSCFLLLKENFLCSAPRCISELSQRWTTSFDDGDGGKDAPSFSPAPQQDHSVKLAGGWR